MSVRPALESKGVPPAIQSRLEAAGLRRTLNTRAVLGLFLARPGANVSHGQVLAMLNARGLQINRVTLYRLLDRLASCGVLQRHADENRTWRFRLVGAQKVERAADPAPRFECDACHRHWTLNDVVETSQALANDLFLALARMGHEGTQLDVLLHGTCAACKSAHEPVGPAP